MNPTKEQLTDPKWWSQNAPPDATHYACEEPTCRPLWVKDGCYSCADEAFVRWREDHAPCVHGELISRPSAWNGEGLPPVGVIVKLRTRLSPEDEFGDWGKAEIMYSSKNAVVWRWQGHSREFGAEWGDVECETIRTPEQIAAEEREKAIQVMYEIVGDIEKVPTWLDALAALHDAGYRKVEQN